MSIEIYNSLFLELIKQDVTENEIQILNSLEERVNSAASEILPTMVEQLKELLKGIKMAKHLFILSFKIECFLYNQLKICHDDMRKYQMLKIFHKIFGLQFSEEQKTILSEARITSSYTCSYRENVLNDLNETLLKHRSACDYFRLYLAVLRALSRLNLNHSDQSLHLAR